MHVYLVIYVHTYVCVCTHVFLTKSNYHISGITVYRVTIILPQIIQNEFGFKNSQTHAPFTELLLLQSAATTTFMNKILCIQNNS